MKKEIGIQAQVQLEKTLMEEDSSNKEIDRKIEEMDRRIRKEGQASIGKERRLDRAEETKQRTSTWSSVVGRKEKKKRRDPSQRKRGELTRRENEEFNRREVRIEGEGSERRTKPLKALKKKLPRGTAVLLELQEGHPRRQ